MQIRLSLTFSALSLAVVAGTAAAAPLARRARSSPPHDSSTSRAPASSERADAHRITAEQVGERAAATSYEAEGQEAKLLRASSVRADAIEQYLPHLSFTARYARLSDFSQTSISGGPAGVNQVFTTQPVGPPGSGIDPATAFAQPPPALTFPNVLDTYLLQATVVAPVSDYLLRIGRVCSAATHAERAARFDAGAARARAAAEGKIAFYVWVRAREAAEVAGVALGDQNIHLEDAKNQLAAGNASRTDVLRAETAVAAAELAIERASNAAELAEKRVRTLVHAGEGERFIPGEGLGHRRFAEPGALHQLCDEALSTRLEMKSFEANLAATHEQASAARAGLWPHLGVFADLLYANPNPRRIPLTSEWLPSWDVGVQLVWSPNEALGSTHAATDAEARAQELLAMRGAVRDAIETEVLQAVQAGAESEMARDAAARELASAEEARRVVRLLFRGGRATASMVADAQTDLVHARLDTLNAAADARIARVRLEHALGRDTRELRGSTANEIY